MGRYASAGRRCDLAVRPSVPFPSSRSAARSIFLVSTGGWRRCAVFVSSFSCVIRWQQGRSFSLIRFARLRSSRLSSRLFVSYGVSCLFFAVRFSSRFCSSIRQHLASHLARRSVFLSLIACLVRRSLMSCLCVSSRRRLVVPVSLARLVKQSVFSRFAGRFVSTARRAGRALSVSRLILFCSRIISLVAFHGHGDGQRLVLPLPRDSVPFPRCPSVIVGAWRWRKWACRSTIRRDAPFYSVRFPHQGGE